MDLHFEAKRDLWLSIVIWIAATVMLAGAAIGFDAGQRFFSSALLVLAAGTLWILYGTYYTLDQDRLVVRSGPFRWNVPLESITSIEPTRDPSSAPATSLDRLEIVYGDGKRILVSPARKEEFRAAIAASLHQ